MAANDEFPRGGIAVGGANAGAAAAITIPGIPGIVHVVDECFASILAIAAAAAGFVSGINISSSSGTINTANALLVVAFAGGAIGKDTDSATSLGLATGPGESVNLAFNTLTPANYNEFVIMKWHDI